MKLLHTSDWHLGQSLNQYARGYEHAQFLAWLLDTLVADQVDTLLIAGDVFDNSNPSSASQSQLYQFLTQARARVPQLGIVMTAGNHDSPGRMEAPAPFLSLLDAYVVGQTGRVGDVVDLGRMVVPLKNRAGQVAAWCIAMPFLRPGDVPRVEAAADPYMAGIQEIYTQAYVHAQAQAQAQRSPGQARPGQAIVAMGHCHITGGQVSVDSERRIVVGGAESLPVHVFDPGIAYVALGHLHLAQALGGDASRRYCGSPLPLSFSEIDYPHQVLIVELEGEQVGATRALRVPRPVQLLRVPKQPAPLPEVLAALQALSLPDVPQEQWPYLQVRVQLSQPEPTLRASVEAALADKPVRLVRIETRSVHTGTSTSTPLPQVSIDELSSLQPTDYFEIDFQKEPLASAGLYAITGPTGSGKSTLLDALCLALYERTPRLTKASTKGETIPDVGDNSVTPSDPRTILRRGAGEGYAEVDFVGSDNLSYRARWSVRRAHGKASGKLQPSEISLTRMADGQRLNLQLKDQQPLAAEVRADKYAALQTHSDSAKRLALQKAATEEQLRWYQQRAQRQAEHADALAKPGQRRPHASHLGPGAGPA